MRQHIWATGQYHCFNSEGNRIPCRGSGQDGELRPGTAWPEDRFTVTGETVLDRLTGLIWSRDGNPGGFPCSWNEALAAIKRLNRKRYCGHDDWRLPNRRELRSLMDYQARKPALPRRHPFVNLFIHWYWASTTAAIHTAYAWWIHMEGARMFYGHKEQEALFWPVRGQGNGMLAATGQKGCFDAAGARIECSGTGQDGEAQAGAPWPVPRFVARQEAIFDRLTGLSWHPRASLHPDPVTWQQALDQVAELAARTGLPWRLPTINELESLTDASRHSPALPADHPFTGLREGYWSSTTSFFETDWAWVLYLEKGACGVGFKPETSFFAWPVLDSATPDPLQ